VEIDLEVLLTFWPEIVFWDHYFGVVRSKIFLGHGERGNECNLVSLLNQLPDDGIGHHEVALPREKEGCQDAGTSTQVQLLKSHQAQEKGVESTFQLL